jgi:Zn-ribbon-containing, possibly RNA-binding protein and truncated derivatives
MVRRTRYRDDPEERRWRDPEPIGKLLNQFLARTGVGRARTAELLVAAWNEAVGELFAKQSTPVTIRRGVLEVRVTAAVFAQELVFRKAEILEKLRELLPAAKVRDIRFKTG